MADNRPIGVFDSGIGGLTVLREIMALLPNESTIYFGDDGRTPYGTKSHDTIIKYCLQIMRFLEEKNVKMIVIACNTASTHAYKILKKYSKVPVIEVVYPGAEAAVKTTTNGKVGIIATQSTISSGGYETAVREKALELINQGVNETALNNLSIVTQACPIFVPLAENGWWDNEVTEAVVKRYLAPVKEFGVDTLVLGCTHYPLLKDAIQREMGEDVTLINSGVSVASVVRDRIIKEGISCDDSAAIHEFYTSDDATTFENVAAPFLGQGLPKGTKRVTVDRYDVSEYV